MHTASFLRLYRLHRLLYAGRKVNSYQLSRRLEISRATLFRDFEKLKDIGAPIHCCPLTKVYSYTQKFELSKLELMEKLF